QLLSGRPRTPSTRAFGKTLDNCFFDLGCQMKTNCDYCGAVIERTEYKLGRVKNHFCDKKCKGNWMALHPESVAGHLKKNGSAELPQVRCAHGAAPAQADGYLEAVLVLQHLARLRRHTQAANQGRRAGNTLARGRYQVRKPMTSHARKIDANHGRLVELARRC